LASGGGIGRHAFRPIKNIKTMEDASAMAIERTGFHSKRKRVKKTPRSRADIVDELVDLFFILGYNGTTLALIAKRTGLGRASLYHHFPDGKEEMARAVLEKAGAWGEEFVCRVLDATDRNPNDRLQVTLRNIDQVHYRPDQLTPANAFAIGEGLELYREHVQTQFVCNAQRVGELLCAIGVPTDVAHRRAWELQIMWEGGLVCARVLNDMSVFRDLMRNMPRYLLAPADAIGCLSEHFLSPLAGR
jgi:TetR/AcrR family transcriptional repressor of lmrAB and yxaGH operons